MKLSVRLESPSTEMLCTELPSTLYPEMTHGYACNDLSVAAEVHQFLPGSRQQ